MLGKRFEHILAWAKIPDQVRFWKYPGGKSRSSVCRSLISACAVSSFSKEVKRGLCPDAAWRPPGLLRGCSALPPAPHLDGQGDRGLCQRHVSVGETETAMPKHRPERRLLHRREGLNLCIQLVPFTTPPLTPPHPFLPLTQHREDSWNKP